MKHTVCIYDLKGNLIGSRRFSCMGCAKKHAPKTTPACVRKGNKNGQIEWTNKHFDKIKDLIK